jgi:hypothetical protein
MLQHTWRSVVVPSSLIPKLLYTNILFTGRRDSTSWNTNPLRVACILYSGEKPVRYQFYTRVVLKKFFLRAANEYFLPQVMTCPSAWHISIRPRQANGKSMLRTESVVSRAVRGVADWISPNILWCINPLLSNDCKQRPLLGNARNIHSCNNRKTRLCNSKYWIGKHAYNNRGIAENGVFYSVRVKWL